MNVGVVGASRGAGFAQTLKRTDFFKCHAVCDSDPEKLSSLKMEEPVETYVDYEEMLERSDIEAVFIGTPMQFHAGMATAALKRGLHVLCEVTAAVTVEECRELALVASQSKAVYMLAENYTFLRPNVLIRQLVDRGLFGQTYYAEGEYIHELKQHNVDTPWRRRWQTGINGVTYGTHSLGPILQWFPGERVVSVTCAGSGHHYRDPDGRAYEMEDSCVMLCQTTKGGLIKIRVDMVSDRPHGGTNYSLQATDGAYESARAEGEPHRIWLRSRAKTHEKWEDLWNLWSEYAPDMWRDMEALEKTGHGGGDILELFYFRDVILGRKPNDLDVHRALDMTLPGLISQQSIVTPDKPWLLVPDSRDWCSK